jgi:hypothetical protein
MSIRFLPCGLAGLAAVLAAAELGGMAQAVLVVAVVAAAGAVLEAVTNRVSSGAPRSEVATAIAALGLVLAAAALRMPLLALGAVTAFVPVPAFPRLHPRREAVLSK